MTSSRTPSLAELIRRMIEIRVLDLFAVHLGRVIKYDPIELTADVQPLFERTFIGAEEEEITEPLPQLPNVPVGWMQFGGWVIDGELSPGDLVLLLFADRSLADWAAGVDKTATYDPGEPRAHDISDAIAFPIMGPRTVVTGAAPLRIRRIGTDTGIELGADGSIALDSGGGATEPLVRGNALNTWLTTSLSVATSFGPSGPAIAPLSPDVLSLLAKLT